MIQHSKRRKRLREWVETSGADAMLVTSAANMQYLTGFRGEGMVLIGDESLISTDRRYEVEAGAVPGRVKAEFCPDGHLAGVIEALKRAGAKRLVFEAETTTYASYETLAAKVDGMS